MNIGDVCSKRVVMISKEASLIDAAKSMREHHVGDLIVVEERGDKQVPIGIITDRDIVVGVIAKDMEHFALLTVGDVMSFDLVTARQGEGVTEVTERMGACGIRRIPVVNEEGGIVGVLTFDDIVCFLASLVKNLSTLVCSEAYREKDERE